MPRLRKAWRLVGPLLLLGAAGVAIGAWVSANSETGVTVVEPGRIVRGAWQNPSVLKRLIEREGIRTIVTLTAINRDDPKYVGQSAVVRQTGVAWIIIPMRGSTATLSEMREAADLIADETRQPVFFHCVGGHHRSNLVHAAYLIAHRGASASEAWRTVAALPWTRPEAAKDLTDRALIEQFAVPHGVVGD